MQIMKSERGRRSYQVKARAEFLVAAELVREGFYVGHLSGNAPNVDLLAASSEGSVIAVQVKGSSRGDWTVKVSAAESKSKSLFYILVKLGDGEAPEYYVLPSSAIAKIRATFSDNATQIHVRLKDARPYKDKWTLLRR